MSDGDDDDGGGGGAWAPVFSAWTPVEEVEALSLEYQDRAVRDLEALLDALEPPWTMMPANKAACVAQLGPPLRAQVTQSFRTAHHRLGSRRSPSACSAASSKQRPQKPPRGTP